MLSWFRQRSRPISAAALVSLITLLAWSSGPHPSDGHDPDFSLVLHDEASHAVGREQPRGTEPLHCVLCHWTQLVRPPASSPTSFAPALEGAPHARAAATGVPGRLQATQPALRGPPTSPVLA